MSDEFEVNYRLRPAKNIERKMMVEILRKLSHINPVTNYQYIGFSSPFFSDFKLFHKELGLESMISIEEKEDLKKRFEFNKPFDCIDVEYGRSDEVLPDIDLNRETILWLDYTTELKRYMFEDIENFCYSAPPGSVIFITLRAGRMSYQELNDSNYDNRFEKLESDVGIDNIPPDVHDIDLRESWSLAEAYRLILLEKIKTDFLLPRNDRREYDLSFEQLANFTYKDSKKMMTIGGMLYSEEIVRQYEKASFDELDVVKREKDQYHINPPKLTFAEMRDIEKKLPSSPTLSQAPVSDEIKERYANVYRYFPRFVESEM
ncbi:O-methyltransferase [Halorubrum salsamenti]|uniref:O-methyltransferase n=1 Tax=Halorubrum salsamenti TaxID=2583990 RepID=UPI00119E347E|nr:O-methyltransferase [Halorubrum salsamenti]